MSTGGISYFCGVIGAIAGLGFGIYAATQNFNPEHQSSSMPESARVFSELLMQAGMILLQSSTLSFVSSLFGYLFEFLAELCRSSSGRLGSDMERIPLQP